MWHIHRDEVGRRATSLLVKAHGAASEPFAERTDEEFLDESTGTMGRGRGGSKCLHWGGAHAQPDDMQYLIWAGTQQPNGAGVTHDPRFQTMFHLRVWEPWQAPAFQADYLIDRLVERRTFGLLNTDQDKANVAVLVQNFGELIASSQPANQPCGSTAASLFCVSDYLATQDSLLARFQPWCVNARVRMKDWTEELMVEFFAQRAAMPDPIPVPTYWLLDSEAHLCQAYGNGGKEILRTAFADARWSSTPVPGFGSQTMAQLYEIERTRPDTQWNADLTAELNVGPVIEHSVRLRDIFTWYGTVCTKARDAIFNECFYQPIRDAYAARGLASPRMANYEDIAADGAVDTFGWMADREPADDVWYDSRTPLTAVSKTYTRGHIDRFSQGQSQNFQYDAQRWSCVEGTASAGHSAPLFYPVGFRHMGGDDLYRLGHPTETAWRAAMRRARHDIESVINSGGGENSASLMPWLWGWGQEGEWTYDSTIIGNAEWIPSLLLCRAKGILRVQVWYPLFTAFGYHTTDEQWQDIRRLHHRIFSPQLAAYTVTVGAEATTNRPGRLTRTLRRPAWLGAEDEYLDRVKITPDSSGVSMTSIEFTGLTYREPETNFCAGSGSLFIEGVLPLEASARIEVLNRNNGKWVAMTPSGVVAAPGWFGTYTPDGDFRDEASANVPTGGRFVSASGQVSVRIVIKHGGDKPAWLDLAQYVTDYNGQPCNGGGTSGGGGGTGGGTQIAQSDMNKDDMVLSDDALRFLTLWNEGSLGADHNLDGLVNEDDLAAYSADFGIEVNP